MFTRRWGVQGSGRRSTIVYSSSAYSFAIFDFRFSEFRGFLAVFQQFRNNQRSGDPDEMCQVLPEVVRIF